MMAGQEQHAVYSLLIHPHTALHTLMAVERVLYHSGIEADYPMMDCGPWKVNEEVVMVVADERASTVMDQSQTRTGRP